MVFEIFKGDGMAADQDRQPINGFDEFLELADILTWGIPDHKTSGQMDGLGAVFLHFRGYIFNVTARAAAAVCKAYDLDVLVPGVGSEGPGPFAQGPEALATAATLIAAANDDADLLHKASNAKVWRLISVQNYG